MFRDREQAEKSAITLQKYIRAQQAREKYAISPLAASELTDYETFILGNDPDIKGLDKFRTNKPFALIGISGLRSLLLACELGTGNHVPKIIIIDNSYVVYHFWTKVKEYFLKQKTKAEFFENFDDFMHSTFNSCRPISSELDIKSFFEKLFHMHHFDYVKQLACHATILKQGWEKKETFIKIKNILTKIGIDTVFMYPSNVAAYCYTQPVTQDAILNNIAIMNPVLCIHTDMPRDKAENFYLITDHQPELVKPRVCIRSNQPSRATDIFSIILELSKQSAITLPKLKKLADFLNSDELISYLITSKKELAEILLINLSNNSYEYMRLIPSYGTLYTLIKISPDFRHALIQPLLEDSAIFEKFIHTNTGFLIACDELAEFKNQLYEKFISHPAHILRLMQTPLHLARITLAFPEKSGHLVSYVLNNQWLFHHLVKNENDLDVMMQAFPEYTKRITSNFHSISSFGHRQQRLDIPNCFFNQTSPHNQLVNAMERLIKQLNLPDSVLMMLDSIKEKNYSRALRMIANYNNSTSLDMAKLLLDFRDELHIKINEQAGNEQNAAIHFAALKKNKPMYDLLVSHGANPELPNKSGFCPVNAWPFSNLKKID